MNIVRNRRITSKIEDLQVNNKLVAFCERHRDKNPQTARKWTRKIIELRMQNLRNRSQLNAKLATSRLFLDPEGNQEVQFVSIIGTKKKNNIIDLYISVSVQKYGQVVEFKKVFYSDLYYAKGE